MCLVDNIFYNLVLIKNDKAQDMIASYGAFAGRVESFMIMIAFLTCIPFIKSWNRVMPRIERDELEGARDRLKRLLHFGSMLFVPVTIFMFIAAKEIQIAFFGKYSSLIDGMPQIGAFVMQCWCLRGAPIPGLEGKAKATRSLHDPFEILFLSS